MYPLPHEHEKCQHLVLKTWDGKEDISMDVLPGFDATHKVRKEVVRKPKLK